MQTKKIISYLKDQDQERLLLIANYLLNKFALIPEIYMLVTMLIGEYREKGSFSAMTIPYFAMLLYSSFVLDYEKDKINTFKKGNNYE